MFTLLKGITENNIGKKGAEAICDALKTNNYLRKLDLSGSLHIYWYSWNKCLKWVIYFDRVYQIQLNLKP